MDKVSGLSCLTFMRKLSEYFNVNLLEIKRKAKSGNRVNILYFEISNMDKLDKLLTYFQLYSLKGVKSLDCSCFKEVYGLMKKKEHLTDLGRKRIREVKLSMNSFRKG